jgi:hypothetical protein
MTDAISHLAIQEPDFAALMVDRNRCNGLEWLHEVLARILSTASKAGYSLRILLFGMGCGMGSYHPFFVLPAQ